MRSDNQNNNVHTVATSVVFDRVLSSHLQDEKIMQFIVSRHRAN